VPPSWDDWFAKLTEHAVFNYYVNDNGTRRFFGNSASDYSTDVLSRETQSFIDNSVATGHPFFAYVAPVPPHEPTIAAPRHEHAFDGVKAPRQPSFNESDVRDKPPLIQSLPLLSSTQIAEIDAATLGRTFIRDANEANAFSKLSRYEATIERSLYKALHELQRLQAARRADGNAPPPVTIDVDVSSVSRDEH
jgi:hypothetical protein